MLNLILKVWRQPSADAAGEFRTYRLDGISTHMSFLEMLDVLNEKLIVAGEEPVAFDHDCREGICGMCGVVINGQAHGPDATTTTCQLHMRRFRDGDTITIEPWRATAFPVIRDLAVDRSAFDRVIAAGGYISVATGNAQDANAILVPRDDAEKAMNAAACIGCGACVAACGIAAMLFVGAKVSHLAAAEGNPERKSRVLSMVAKMDANSSVFEHRCEAACPAGISVKQHCTAESRIHETALTANEAASA
jgi:succinate dehydrogenase / fumarate reductase iron-sulfur subunit